MKYTHFLIFISVFNFSCGHNECDLNLFSDEIDETYCPKIDTLSLPLDKPHIKKINIFLDASGSMEGYMPSTKPSSKFQKLIPDIFSHLSTKYPNSINFYPIYDSKSQRKPLALKTAETKIIYGQLTKSNGDTYLPLMLDSIYTHYFDSDAVNIFISDCIYSPKKEDKKITDQATKEIRESIINYSNDYYTSIFCLFSENYTVQESPYYLIVFGKPENNQEIEKLVVKSIIDNNQKFNEVNYGLKYNLPYYSVLPYTGTTFNCIANPCENLNGAYLNVSISDWKEGRDSLSFWIGIDLKDFPTYSKTQTYLENNLIASIGLDKVKITSITNHKPKDLNNDDKIISEKCTHYIRISITQLDACAEILNLSLLFQSPDWITILDEPTSENNREKTFGLVNMMKGFDKAYNINDKVYFFNNLKISLVKQ